MDDVDHWRLRCINRGRLEIRQRLEESSQGVSFPDFDGHRLQRGQRNGLRGLGTSALGGFLLGLGRGGGGVVSSAGAAQLKKVEGEKESGSDPYSRLTPK